MVYSEIYIKHDTKTIVMEETNRQSLYVCFAAHMSGIADWMKSVFLLHKRENK